MRKDKKQLLINIIRSLYEAHESIRKLHKSGDIDVVRSLLGDCQEAVLSIGDAIIDSETEDCVTIRYIQDYCESIFNIHQSISENTDIKEVEKTLNHDLTLIKKSIEKDIKVRLEVVFLPYKASMWDSLESVWKAADEDPECDAYVVPIPYYDRNPDYSFGEFHYEGGEYPDYVPVTHYNNYDISKRRPDVIYIHNPYDDCNYVTSVDPRFYSRELKKYTDKLVYIPYFVVSDNVPEHFCALPACINSDYVIVQSDQVNNTYIQNYINSTGYSNGSAECKFLSLGSPKFDAVLNANNMEYDIPESWRQIIGDKKIVLYNTSVGAILNGDELYLNKLISVFEFFLCHKDVILWWRPHPLSSAVYNSMRNHLIDRYLELIDWYKKSGFGIYDDTPDLHRAIAYSDAYFGDRSSLVALYQLTGKPILLQNIQIIDYDFAKYNIGFEDVYDDGEYLWFSAINFNGLFRIKKTDMSVEFINFFPDEPIDGKRLFGCVTESNGKLFFSPFSASSIAVYDISSGSFEKIEIDLRYERISTAKLYTSFSLNSKIYFIPCAYDAIICYNVENKKCLYYTDWMRFVDNNGEFQGQYFGKAVVYGNNIYLPMMNSKELLVLNTVSGKSTQIKDGFDKMDFICAIFKEQKIYLSPYGEYYYTYNMERQAVECVNLYEYPSPCDLPFSGICDCGDYFLLFPYHADSIIRIDTLNQKISVVDHKIFNDRSLDRMDYYDGKYVFAKRIGDQVYAYNVEYSALVIYNIMTSEWSILSININSDDLCKIKENKHNAFSFVNSSSKKADETNYLESILTISDLYDYLTKSNDSSDSHSVTEKRSFVRKKSLSNPDGTAGIKIYKTIKKMVLNQ